MRTQDTLVNELKCYPVKFSLEKGGKHPFILVETMAGKSFRFVYSGTSVDHRAILNARQMLRRKLREFGVEPYPEERRNVRIGSLGEKLLEGVRFDAVIIDDPIAEEFPSEIAVTEEVPMLQKVHVETQEAATKKRQHIKQEDAVHITRLMITAAAIDDVQRRVTYNEGWSDDRIVELLNSTPGRSPITIERFKAFRRDQFGHLADECKRSQEASEAMVIGRLKSRISSLEERMQALEDIVTKS